MAAGIDGIASLYAGQSSTGIVNAAALSPAVLQAKYGAMSPQKVDAAAKDFESMFIGQMVEQMFGDSSGEDAFGGGEANDVYKGLLVEQYGKLIANSGGIGIASYVKQELLKQQEIPHEPSKTTASSGA